MTKKLDKVMIFAGEASGDLQGAMLARELRKFNSQVQISGVGGIRMRKEGIHLLFDSTTLGVIGALEGIKILPTLLNHFTESKKTFIETHPDLVIFIDTPAVNMRLAKIARHEGIKSIYYFPPSAWSGNVKRAKKIANCVDLVVNAFKFAADTYDRGGIKHFYTGHPLVDFMQKWKNANRKEILSDLGLEDGPLYIALLPGSRSQEIKYILPILISVAEKLKKRFPDVHFLMPIASPLLRDRIEEKLKNINFPLTIFLLHAPEVMAVSRLAIMASGSVALECGILETPMIITYCMNWIDYKIIRAFIKLRWVGLPNLILQREVVPELLQEKATVSNICRWAEELIPDGEKRQKMIGDLKELNSVIGEPGVVSRIASYIWENVL